MKNIKLKIKLTGGFLIVAFVALGVGLVGYTGLHKTIKMSKKIKHSDVLVQEFLQREIDHMNWRSQLGLFQRNEQITQIDLEKDEHKCKFGKFYYGEGRVKVEEEVPGIAEIFKEMEEPHKRLHHSAITIENLLKKGREYRKDASRILDEESSVQMGVLKKHFADIKVKIDDHMAVVDKHAEASASTTEMVIMVVMFLGFAIAVGLGLYLSTAISRPVSAMSIAAAKIAKGEIDQEVTYESKDEIGILAESFRDTIKYFKDIARILDNLSHGDLTVLVHHRSEKDAVNKSLALMVQNLRETLTSVNEGTVQVSSASQQVSSASQSLSQGATEQAASIEEISSSMTEIGSQTKTNAENASQANNLAVTAKSAAEKGKDEMELTVVSMNEINTASQQIAKIIKAIDDIAFQTNLLALNAAVEAARAGRHGKDFAVVADEVRNLASRSAKAARETAELIETSGKKVETGLAVASKTSEAFKDIVNGIIKVADLVAEIAAASNEQANAVSQVAQAINQIDQITQQNTASAEQTASSAEELASQAEELQNLLSQFKLSDEHGTSRGVVPKRPQHKVSNAVQKNSGSKGSAENWGRATQAQQMMDHVEEVKPEEVIALDDKEFGKY